MTVKKFHDPDIDSSSYVECTIRILKLNYKLMNSTFSFLALPFSRSLQERAKATLNTYFMEILYCVREQNIFNAKMRYFYVTVVQLQQAWKSLRLR